MRYSRSFFQLKMYMPMEARSLFGCLGFSSNSFMYPSGPTFIMPKRVASSIETCSTEIVQAASFSICSRSISE